MNRSMSLCFVVVAASACNDATDIPVCSTSHLDLKNATCFNTQILVSRDIAGLTPEQEDLDRYADRWQRAADAEPWIGTSLAGAQRYLADGQIRTTNPLVIAAWKTQQVVTGDPVFDALMASAGAAYIDGYPSEGSDGSFLFSYSPYGVFNESIFSEQLAATDTAIDGTVPPGLSPDATWAWLDSDVTSGSDNATAQLSITLAWGGDCGFAGCTYSHQLRAVVPPSGDAVVYDLGGDPIQLDPRTKPL
jgi:hypothetical protein